jgi:hypothetical protein
MSNRMMVGVTMVILLAGFATNIMPRHSAAGGIVGCGLARVRVYRRSFQERGGADFSTAWFENLGRRSSRSVRHLCPGARFRTNIHHHGAVIPAGRRRRQIPSGSHPALRAEHTWPLALAANELGYASALEMIADNKATIRILVMSSGAEGTPDLADDSTVTIEGADANVLPFDMDTEVTFFQMTGPRIGAFLVVVPFADGEDPDKDVIIKVTDTVTETTWDPPRPWIYDPVNVSVRNGFSTPTIRIFPKID